MTTALRHSLLYAEQNWKQTGRLLFILSLGYGIFGSIGLGVYTYFHDHAVSPMAVQLVYYIPLSGIVYAAYRVYRWRAHLEFGELGLRVFKIYQVRLIPYDLIRGGRIMTLRGAYTNGLPKYVPPLKKPFLDQSVLVLKLKGDPLQIAHVRKSLGTYYTVDSETLAFPVPDPELALNELRAHLPEKLGANMGGAQRRARRRR